jgi:hypothetical protein
MLGCVCDERCGDSRAQLCPLCPPRPPRPPHPAHPLTLPAPLQVAAPSPGPFRSRPVAPLPLITPLLFSLSLPLPSPGRAPTGPAAPSSPSSDRPGGLVVAGPRPARPARRSRRCRTPTGPTGPAAPSSPGSDLRSSSVLYIRFSLIPESLQCSPGESGASHRPARAALMLSVRWGPGPHRIPTGPTGPAAPSSPGSDRLGGPTGSAARAPTDPAAPSSPGSDRPGGPVAAGLRSAFQERTIHPVFIDP